LDPKQNGSKMLFGNFRERIANKSMMRPGGSAAGSAEEHAKRVFEVLSV
jgi:hypothetical protein